MFSLLGHAAQKAWIPAQKRCRKDEARYGHLIVRASSSVLSPPSSVLILRNGFPEAFGYADRVAGILIDCHRNYVSRGNQPAGRFLEYGKFEGETGVSYIAHPYMDVQGLIEKSPPLVMAIRLDIKKIQPFAQKVIIVVTGCPEVFDQPYVEIVEVVAEENMPLHVCFHVSNLYGGEKFERVFQIRPPFKNSPTFNTKLRSRWC